MAKYSNDMKQKSGGFAPKGITALNTGKGTSSEAGINKGKAQRDAGEMYKKPGKTGRGLVGARSDQSSSEVGPIKGGKYPGCDNIRTYGGIKQPAAFTNLDGVRPTKFVR